MINPTTRLHASFLFFLLITAFLSWVPFSIWGRMVLFPGALFLLLAAALGLGLPDSKDESPIFLRDLAEPLSLVGGLLFLAAAAWFRFYHLDDLQVWPMWDDADLGYFAIRLSEKWSWPFSFGPEKLGPLFTWLQGFFFRLSGPSISALWLCSALLSAAVVPLAYFACRQYSSRSFSTLYAFIVAIGFPFVYEGRFCEVTPLMWIWQFALLWMLGSSFKKSFQPARVFGIGLCTALGLYVCVITLGTCLFVALIFASFRLQKGKRSLKPLIFFLAGFLPASLPVGLIVFPDIIKGHLAAHFMGSEGPISWLHQFSTFFSYFSGLFFGSIDQSYWSFGPLWGGFFNPLLGAFFFLGVMEFKRWFSSPVSKGLLLAFAAIAAPLLLVNTVEFVRISQYFPLIVWMVTMGLFTLAQGLKPRIQWRTLLCLLALSLALDSRHLFGVFHHWSITQALTPGLAVKSPERYRAFQILKEQSDNEGPGLVFSDFVSDIYDQSLLVCAYPFNAARNPRLDPQQATWAGILCELHYEIPIQTRFPKARFFLLSDPKSDDGPLLALALIPLEPGAGSRPIRSWVAVHQKLQDLYAIMPYQVKNPDFGPVIQGLFSLFPSCEKDPLLKAWLEEKLLDILLVDNNVTGGLGFLDKPLAATATYPFLDGKFAHLYHRLGLALVKSGQYSKARESFTRASKFDPKYDLKKFLALCG